MYRVFCFLINPVLLLVEARLFSYSVAKRAPSTDPASMGARLFNSVAKRAPSTDPASMGARLFSYSVAKRAPSTDPASVGARLPR